MMCAEAGCHASSRFWHMLALIASLRGCTTEEQRWCLQDRTQVSKAKMQRLGKRARCLSLPRPDGADVRKASYVLGSTGVDGI